MPCSPMQFLSSVAASQGRPAPNLSGPVWAQEATSAADQVVGGRRSTLYQRESSGRGVESRMEGWCAVVQGFMVSFRYSNNIVLLESIHL